MEDRQLYNFLVSFLNTQDIYVFNRDKRMIYNILNLIIHLTVKYFLYKKLVIKHINKHLI